LSLDDELCDQALLPRPPKAGYEIQPSMIELARMSLRELKTLQEFTIQNQHGKI
jgi:hypothetical protein